MTYVQSWSFFEPNADTMAERAMVITLVVLVFILNVYGVAKLLNLCRALWSTNFFTNKPLQGGYIAQGSEPEVTIQICCYNEEAVIEATINAACSVDWPKDKLFVQVLDDSTDNTVEIVEALAASWSEKGVNCTRLSRPTRRGYKAGNLHDMEDKVQGDFVALFDADHRCDVNFLRRTVPHFFSQDGSDKSEIGLVQVPWAYYNADANLLTEYDALALDVSHVVEQQGRSAALGCFGFNGTGGIWRREAVKAGGGWQWDTVTEDLDLSYLAHLAGYKFVYLRDIPQQLELPAGCVAHKQQKHRWTKGFWQVLRKSYWNIFTNKESSIAIKFEAFTHMTGAIANPISLLVMIIITLLTYQGILTLPLILYSLTPMAVVILTIIATCYGKVAGPEQRYKSFWSRTARIGLLPIMVIMGIGMSVYETYALYDGLVSNDATFLRTPKEGSSKHKGAVDDAEDQVIENVMKKNKKRGGFMTEMMLICIGMVLTAYFATFSLYQMAREGWALGSLWCIGFLLPAIGLGFFHTLMLQALLARRAEQKSKDRVKTLKDQDGHDPSHSAHPYSTSSSSGTENAQDDLGRVLQGYNGDDKEVDSIPKGHNFYDKKDDTLEAEASLVRQDEDNVKAETSAVF